MGMGYAMSESEETTIFDLLEDNEIFKKDFCTNVTLSRLEGVPVSALRRTVKQLADLLPRSAWTSPEVWSPTTAPMPVLVIGRLDKGGKVLASKVALAVMDGQLRLVAEEQDVAEAKCSPDNWEPWSISRRGTLRQRDGFLAHKAPLTDLTGEPLNFAEDLLAFLQWFGRRSFVAAQTGGRGTGHEVRVAWPQRVAELRAGRLAQPNTEVVEAGAATSLYQAISAIPMSLKEAYSILPIGHALKAAVGLVSGQAAPSSAIEAAERQAALRYLRAFQLLASEFGIMEKTQELDLIRRDLVALSRRIAELPKNE